MSRKEVRIRTQLIWLRCAMGVLVIATRLNYAWAETATARPPIVGVADITVKTDSLEAARKFYSGVVGLTEAFQTRTTDGGAPRATFKVNDHQYVNVSPG